MWTGFITSSEDEQPLYRESGCACCMSQLRRVMAWWYAPETPASVVRR